MEKFSTIDHATIRNHQTNKSPTKIAHQFSKTKRFSDPNPQCPLAFYTYDSQLSNRKASFGYGNKSDFTKTLTVSPPSSKYIHKSIFENSEKRGRSFGCARDLSPDRSYLIPQLQKIPGPGKYENQIQTRMRVSYSLRPKTDDVIKKNFTYLKTPGPGSYQEINLDPKTGRFMVSKFSDAKLSKINPKTPRFIDYKDGPSPLTYKEKDDLNGTGKYYLSSHRGSGTRVFSKTARPGLWPELKTPGPGKYEPMTQFGAYGDAKYYKTLSTFKSTIN